MLNTYAESRNTLLTFPSDSLRITVDYSFSIKKDILIRNQL